MKATFKRILASLLIVAMTAGLIPSYAAENITVTVSVETRTVNGQDLVEPTQVTVPKGTNLETILLRICEEKKIEVDNSQGYVSSIGGIKNDPVQYHAWSGWVYWVNEAPGSVGAAQYIPADGDTLRWRFSVSGDMYGSDVIFADDYRLLQEQIAIVDAFRDEDYAKYTDEELNTLLTLYGDATAKKLEIDTYPSEQGKAAGLPGFILAKNVSPWSGEGQIVRALSKKLAFAIEKKQYIPAESISLNPTRITLVKGQRIQLKATILPQDATDQAILWDTMNLQGEASKEVQVSQDGTVFAKEVTNFATVRARHSEVLSPGTCIVKVVAPPEDSALTSLSLTGATLRPSFQKSQHVYRAQVSEETQSIRVKAEAPGATITIAGQSGNDLTVPLQPGENWIEVTSQVAGKPEMTYRVRVVRRDYKKQFGKIADNITKSYEYTSDVWRILDTVFYKGRENAKVNKQKYFENVRAALSSESLPLGTLATHILTLTALGEDPTSFMVEDTAQNLVEKLATHPGYENAGKLDIYSTCAALYAMMPYTPNGEQAWTAKKMADALIATQMADGCWGFDEKNGDIDVTAMIATALAPLKSDRKIQDAVKKAISYLANAQENNGGYSSFGSNNANSAEMVLIALCANGIDAANDSRFVKNGYNVLDALETFVTEDACGLGFTDNTYNSFATEQGLRAFATYVRFLEKNRPSKGVSPYIYTGVNGQVVDGSASDANLSSLTIKNANLQPGFDAAVTEYSATLDADYVEIQATAAGEATISPRSAPLNVGENIIPVTVTAKDGNQKIYSLTITRPSNGSGGQTGGGQPIDRNISIAIIGYQGENILTEQSMKILAGDTPYTVLKRAAEANDIEITTTGSGSSIYISSINGCAELDYGPDSGWMYSINGKYHQKSANSIRLKAGDKLVWIYTVDLGNDIGGGNGTGGSNQKPQQDLQQADVEKLIAQTQKVLYNQKEWSLWEAFGLAISGNIIPQSYQNEMRETISRHHGEFRKITDTAGYILLSSALGYNAQKIEQINLIESLLNSERMKNQGTNGPIFALIAMDCVPYSESFVKKWTRNALVGDILEVQNTDGGIALTKGETSNVDLTAMALIALANYRNETKVRAACDRMITYLSKQQKASGGFALYGVENCESAAQVIMALRAQGISLQDQRFVKNKKSVFDAMSRYRLQDGTYSHEVGGKTDRIATEQAFLALLSTKKEDMVYRIPKRAFLDEAEISAWAKESALLSHKQGIILGEFGCFVPKRALSRAELAQILVRALQLKGNETIEYQDVSKQDWYYQAICAVSKNGLMFGSNEKFRPNDRITREELAVVIARVAKLSGTAQISDMEQVSEWAKEAVQAVYQHGIMQGSGDRFCPKDFVTREMAATVCMRMFDLIK